MKVNLSLEVSDEQRNVLASILANRPVKALAKRDDVRHFVEGCIAGLTTDLVPAAPTKKTPGTKTATYDVGDGRTVTIAPGPNVTRDYHQAWLELLTDKERKTYDRLVAEGKPDGYIRGYFYIERKRSRGDTPLKDNP